MQKRFLQLAIPNVLANLTVPLAGLIDVAFLGHLPKIEHLAGVALGTLIFDYCYWGFGFLRMGTTGLAAQAHGAQDKEELLGILGRGLILGVLFGCFLLACQTLIGTGSMALLQGEPGAEVQGLAYFYARIWSAPATLCFYVLMGWFMGRQMAKTTFVLALLVNGMNVVLDYWFIVKLGWGAQGAGWATGIAEISGCLLSLLIAFQHVYRMGWFHVLMLKSRERWLGLFRLNRDITVRTLALISAFALFTNISAGMGNKVLAANAILLKLLSTCAYFIDGYAFALEALAGAAHGAKDWISRRKSLWIALSYNVGTVFLLTGIYVAFGDQILGLLTDHLDVIHYAKDQSVWLFLTLMFSGFAYIFDGYFIGLSQGHLLRKSMVMSFCLGFLPFALVAHLLESQKWLWLSMVLFMVARAWTLGKPALRQNLDP